MGALKSQREFLGPASEDIIRAALAYAMNRRRPIFGFQVEVPGGVDKAALVHLQAELEIVCEIVSRFLEQQVVPDVTKTPMLDAQGWPTSAVRDRIANAALALCRRLLAPWRVDEVRVQVIAPDHARLILKMLPG